MQGATPMILSQKFTLHSKVFHYFFTDEPICSIFVGKAVMAAVGRSDTQDVTSGLRHVCMGTAFSGVLIS